eukprot:sb/3466284/
MAPRLGWGYGNGITRPGIRLCYLYLQILATLLMRTGADEGSLVSQCSHREPDGLVRLQSELGTCLARLCFGRPARKEGLEHNKSGTKTLLYHDMTGCVEGSEREGCNTEEGSGNRKCEKFSLGCCHDSGQRSRTSLGDINLEEQGSVREGEMLTTLFYEGARFRSHQFLHHEGEGTGVYPLTSDSKVEKMAPRLGWGYGNGITRPGIRLCYLYLQILATLLMRTGADEGSLVAQCSYREPNGLVGLQGELGTCLARLCFGRPARKEGLEHNKRGTKTLLYHDMTGCCKMSSQRDTHGRSVVLLQTSSHGMSATFVSCSNPFQKDNASSPPRGEVIHNPGRQGILSI